MSTAEGVRPVTAAEADALFADLADEPAVVLAISGGPDSTALLLLAAGWRKRRGGGPKLVAVTVDHGLRPDARREAAAVKRLAGQFGIEHRTLRWRGPKPASGLQEKARVARYRLLHAAARKAKARCVVTAHTLDDQAETVLFRLARGSGPAGIAGMARAVSLDGLLSEDLRPRAVPSVGPGLANAIHLVRPLLDVEKARLIATLRVAGIAYAQDPSNNDPRFARTRMRGLIPILSTEGLTAHRLAHLARRVRRTEEAIEAVVAAAADRMGLAATGRTIAMNRHELCQMPAEIALRLIGRAVGMVGDEGPVELGKLEALSTAVTAVAGDDGRFRRTLAGAMVSVQADFVTIERAPARRRRPKH